MNKKSVITGNLIFTVVNTDFISIIAVITVMLHKMATTFFVIFQDHITAILNRFIQSFKSLLVFQLVYCTLGYLFLQ